jgi:MFS family permease
MVSAAVTVPWYSAFSDIFGRKAMLLTGVTFFTAGSFVAAVSGNFSGLHFGRVVQGIGAGGFCLLSDLIVADLLSEKERRKWSTLIGAAYVLSCRRWHKNANKANRWAIGAITGPMIGESLAEHDQFRWLFWINVPLGASSLAILAFAAQPESERAGPILPKLLAFDWLGLMLLSGSLISLLLGLTRVS